MPARTLSLDALGWSPGLAEPFETHARNGLVPARVIAQHRGGYALAGETGELAGRLAGRLRHEAADPTALPAVGDWVAVRLSGATATIEAVLPRRTCFVRRASSDWDRVAEGQVVAANVDVVLVATSLDHDLNLRRLERYLAVAWESGAEPAIVLTKRDLCRDVELAVLEVEAVAMGVPVHAVSALGGEGLDAIRSYVGPGRTAALLGSSGVGKSTLVNGLAGEERQTTATLRADGRGRHTTTARELVAIPGGGLLLDTPGMRSLGLWDSADALDGAFADVTALAERCRFSDCGHEREPGCAVRAAVERGELDAERLASWERLRREAMWIETRRDARAVAEERRRRRRFARSLRKASW